MNEANKFDEQLIRWLEGDLKGEELSVFEASPGFKEYQKIIDTTNEIEYPVMDENAVFAKIQERIPTAQKDQKPTQVFTLQRVILSIAAVLVLGFAVVNLLPSTVDVTAGVGQYVSHTLPDGSEVNLNGNSSIEYTKSFSKDRALTLEGEAFFDVKKGQSFVVQTSKGSVSVLGTSFNVFSRNDILIVACKTGKVKVETDEHSAILEKGERIHIIEENTTGKENFAVENIGSWLDGTSYFSNARLEEVILSMRSHYEIELDLPSQFRNKRFTGSFVHNDIEKALKMVFSPMGISYSYGESGEVLFTDK